jgi:hypothetical protein
MTCFYIPPYVNERLARHRPDLEGTVHNDAGFRAVRSAAIQAKTPGTVLVYDAGSGTWLPGARAGDDLEQAARVRAFIQASREVIGTGDFPGVVVRYGRGYANAFYNGRYLVFGQGDGEVFGDFTEALDVFAHERGHDVVGDGPGLVYSGQSGALNEHLADVMGIATSQYRQGYTEDWRLGQELFLDGVSALRDMMNPGTAYSTELLGDDPQPGHMSGYVHTTEDSGGVHINSGIPSRAFAVFCAQGGLRSWEEPLRIWLAAMGMAGKHTDFTAFARMTVVSAGEYRKAVVDAWASVGIIAS